MPVFELRPVSKPDGSFSAAWFDDDARLWNDKRLSSVASVASSWQAPRLNLLEPAYTATPVLFNPNALAACEEIRNELSRFPELEFLPIRIEGHADFYLLHVTKAIELPELSRARVAPPPSGNIVGIEAFSTEFEPGFAFFRVLQPAGSAARRSGASTRSTYVNAIGASAIESCAHGYLAAIALGGA